MAAVAAPAPPAAAAPVAAATLPLPAQILLAGLSNCVAASFTNPIDVAKVRLQLQGELGAGGPRKYTGLGSTMVRIAAEEGVLGWYKGWAPAMVRELSYSGLRLGLYEPMKHAITAVTGPQYELPSLLLKIAAGGCSGVIGAALTTPADLLKVRLQADARRSAATAAGAGAAASTAPAPRSMVSMLSHIYATEGGLKGLWQGTGPNTQRAALLTAAQVGSYDEAKHLLRTRYGVIEEGLALHCASSMIAGLAAALVTSPVDTAKTRIMNQLARLRATATATAATAPSPTTPPPPPPPPPQPVMTYTSTLDCMAKTLRAEGWRGLYKGFWAQWMRLGPHTIITFIVYEQLRTAVGMKPV